MPLATRRRDATARRIMKVLGDDTSTANNSSNPAVVQDEWTKDDLSLVLQDLEESLNDRLSLLATETSKAKDAQKQVHVKSMVKIRKQVRGMSVRQFNETYGCDLLQLLQMPGAANKKRIRPEAMATPAPSKNKGIPNTASRTVQRGEMIYSKNGSPVATVDEGALVATVTKKRRRGGNNAAEETVGASFDINVGEGRFISLSNPGNVDALDDDLKSTAIHQLQVLQDQMSSLMAQLKN